MPYINLVKIRKLVVSEVCEAFREPFENILNGPQAAIILLGVF